MAKVIWRQAPKDSPIFNGQFIISSRKIKVDPVKPPKQKVSSKPKTGRAKKTKDK